MAIPPPGPERRNQAHPRHGLLVACPTCQVVAGAPCVSLVSRRVLPNFQHPERAGQGKQLHRMRVAAARAVAKRTKRPPDAATSG